MKKLQRGFWETDVRRLDFRKPHVLRAYIERKITVGDWAALDRRTVRANLDYLTLGPHLRELLRRCLGPSRTPYAKRTHARATHPPHRRRRK